MKSQHRHELQQNELRKVADRLTRFFETYGNQLIWGLCAVVVVAAGVIYWVRSSQASQQAGWTQFAVAESAEDFANVADQYEGTDLGAWARLREGELHLENGLRLMFSDRAAAESDLKQAEENFKALLNQEGIPERVRERALFGLGHTLETLAGEETGPAIDAYSRLVEEFPDSLFRPRAEERIQVLQTGGAKGFYAWFSKQEPPERNNDLGGPQDAMQGRGGAMQGGQSPFGGQLGGQNPFHQGRQNVTLPPVPDQLRIPTESPEGEGESSGPTLDLGTPPEVPSPGESEEDAPAESEGQTKKSLDNENEAKSTTQSSSTGEPSNEETSAPEAPAEKEQPSPQSESADSDSGNEESEKTDQPENTEKPSPTADSQ